MTINILAKRMRNTSTLFNVAIIGRNTIFRSALTAVLNSFSRYHVINTVPNAEAFIETIGSLPSIDILITDLPAVDTVTYFSMLKSVCNTGRYMILDELKNDSLAFDVFRCGIRAWLHEYCAVEELKYTLDCVMAGDFYYNDDQDVAALAGFEKNRISGGVRPEYAATVEEIKFLRMYVSNIPIDEMAMHLNKTAMEVATIKQLLMSRFHARNKIEMLIYALQFIN